MIGKVSAVSVLPAYQRQGIGQLLIKAAEEHMQIIARQLRAINCELQMGVINKRTDLFPWYEKQGYHIIGEIHPNDPEVERITLDEMKDEICCILMKKSLKI